MTTTRAADLRRQFLRFFESHGHTIVASSPLVPANDPTLMFTNAGMVQFKDVFVGQEARPYRRATTCQKCMRVSGKHNDLEEVGRTARHHTFFEMLGNFSFGDYFKEEAITLAWEFVTREVGLDRSRLWVTVFGGEAGLPADEEAESLWRKISGLPSERILRLGMKENFWAMGETGPCGPCTEIHFDTGGAGAVQARDFETGRVIEIWNNVFMQFNRHAGGQLVPLPKPSVDTGMGLERLASVVANAGSNYHTDLFLPLLDKVAELAGKVYRRSDSDDDVSMRVIADHARATAFLVADGVQPSNEGRGYVMRRIMRRAIRHGRRLGLDDVFFHGVVDVVAATMSDTYPELTDARALIGKVAETEERGFRRTLDAGLRILDDEITNARATGATELAGDTIFRLYDTYGFPKDLTEVVAREHQLGIDEQGFARAMEEQRERSRGSELGGEAIANVHKGLAREIGSVRFLGYTHEDAPLAERDGSWRQRDDAGIARLELATEVRAIVQNGERCDAVGHGVAEVVLDPTPFYGESGGQVGDRGLIVDDSGVELEVLNTEKPVEGLTVSRVRINAGTLRIGDRVWAGYVPQVRKETRAHHSATHLLHAALRDVLGQHVKQAGSFVDAEHLRFDYTHFAPPTADELAEIESRVNRAIAENAPVVTDVLPIEQAKAKGALAFFGEKYGDVVRVITMGSSVELCGGTHARHTGDIGMLVITREESVASGVRRVEAEVGLAARRRVASWHALLTRAAALLSSTAPADAPEEQPTLLAIAKGVRTAAELASSLGEAVQKPTMLRVRPLPDKLDATQAARIRDTWTALTRLASSRGNEIDDLVGAAHANDEAGLVAAFGAILVANRQRERLVDTQRRGALGEHVGTLLAAATTVAGVRVLAARVDAADAKQLRELADRLRDKLESGILCLGSAHEDKAAVLVAVTKDLTSRFKAGQLIAELAPLIGGRGGGKPDLAQAGGNRPQELEALFTRFKELVSTTP